MIGSNPSKNTGFISNLDFHADCPYLIKETVTRWDYGQDDPKKGKKWTPDRYMVVRCIK